MIGRKLSLLVILAIPLVSCYRNMVATSDGMSRTKSNPSASPLPLELHSCASGKSVEVDETGVLTFMSGGDVSYGQVSRDQLDTLQSLLASAEYVSELRRGTREQPGPIVCMGEPSVYIIHKARGLAYKFIVGDGTPASIKSLLQTVDSLAGQAFGPGYVPFAWGELGVKPNPPLNPTVSCVTPPAKYGNRRAARPAG
jgi:hypothetical protein